MYAVTIDYQDHVTGEVAVLKGISSNYPRTGEFFCINSGAENINMGKVINIFNYEDFLLIQTTKAVGEVWIKPLSSEETLLDNYAVPSAVPSADLNPTLPNNIIKFKTKK